VKNLADSDVQFADELSGERNTRCDGRQDLSDKEDYEVSTVSILTFFSFCVTLKSHKHQSIAIVRRRLVKEMGTRSQYHMATETICWRRNNTPEEVACLIRRSPLPQCTGSVPETSQAACSRCRCSNKP
jgi:hypothetical protein